MKITKKINKWSKLYKKRVLQMFLPYSHDKKLLFIVGCQRSGTTLIQDIFENDLQTNVYGEFSKMSRMDKEHGIRMNPLHIVKKEIARDNAPFTVMKPLVESQHINKLLNYFENSKALWAYRNYMDVASSDLKEFGLLNGIDNLRPVVENIPDNWRAENVSENTRKKIREYFSEEMNPNDAAVLFWWLRNSLYFDLKLDEDPRVLMCKYEFLIRFPGEMLSYIYNVVGQDFPGAEIYSEINADSLGKGKNIQISPEIKHLADQMMDRLNSAFFEKNPEFQHTMETRSV